MYTVGYGGSNGGYSGGTSGGYGGSTGGGWPDAYGGGTGGGYGGGPGGGWPDSYGGGTTGGQSDYYGSGATGGQSGYYGGNRRSRGNRRNSGYACDNTADYGKQLFVACKASCAKTKDSNYWGFYYSCMSAKAVEVQCTKCPGLHFSFQSAFIDRAYLLVAWAI